MGDGASMRIDLPKHQVAIAGRVTDVLSTKPVASALVLITESPVAFQRRVELSGWPNTAITAEDGCFHFDDLPDGAYKVQVSGPKGSYYGDAHGDFTVQRNAQGNINALIKPIALSPTGVSGLVKSNSQGNEALPLACIRVEDDEIVAYSGLNGQFMIRGIQPGPRRLSISASGYATIVVQAPITLGFVNNLQPILLQPLGK